ncbi:MAG TPA: CorA family divalent cation transporter [Rudaea sp.]|uniref:CorA family divalent cation transporter n=1 Tax=Rudaea sp. TaxID=2136325 RepID=UPI002F93B75B
MLTSHPSKRSASQVAPVWIDLVDPSEDERKQAAAALGARLPTRDQISAIELSSRLRSDQEILRLNIPAFVRNEDGQGAMTPLGFVLTPKLLVSLRYADSIAFKHMAEVAGSDSAPHDSIDTFVGIIEAIVNVGADRMEAIASDLSKLTRTVFADSRDQRRQLRGALFKVGSLQRQITQIRAAMLGVSRVVSYLCEVSPPWIDKKHYGQFKTVHADIGSLAEFDQQLSDRLQFLLDAVLGFINNDQNDIMKVLTVITVVTIPPMILAGIWGMNFKSIGEYNWPHGYAFALTMIAISVIVPLLWFKWKRWF